MGAPFRKGIFCGINFVVDGGEDSLDFSRVGEGGVAVVVVISWSRGNDNTSHVAFGGRDFGRIRV